MKKNIAIALLAMFVSGLAMQAGAVELNSIKAADFSELQEFKVSAPVPHAQKVKPAKSNIEEGTSLMLYSLSARVDSYCAKLLKMDVKDPAFQLTVGKLAGSVEAIVMGGILYGEMGYLDMNDTAEKLAAGVIQSAGEDQARRLIQSIRRQNAELLKLMNLPVVPGK